MAILLFMGVTGLVMLHILSENKKIKLEGKRKRLSKVAAIVFSTVELTEAIYAHLDTKDIVASLETCRALNLTIRGSHKLDQRRFLEPAPIHACLKRQPGALDGEIVRYGAIPSNSSIPIVALNPIFGSPRDLISVSSHRHFVFELNVNQLRDIVYRCGNTAAAMFVTQPPVPELEIRYSFLLHHPSGDGRTIEEGTISGTRFLAKTVRSARGVQIGHLVKNLKAMLARGQEEYAFQVSFPRDRISVTVNGYAAEGSKEVVQAKSLLS